MSWEEILKKNPHTLSKKDKIERNWKELKQDYEWKWGLDEAIKEGKVPPKNILFTESDYYSRETPLGWLIVKNNEIDWEESDKRFWELMEKVDYDMNVYYNITDDKWT